MKISIKLSAATLRRNGCNAFPNVCRAWAGAFSLAKKLENKKRTSSFFPLGGAHPFGGATSQLHLYRFLSISLSFFSPQKVLV
jgi:hypothetical protein